MNATVGSRKFSAWGITIVEAFAFVTPQAADEISKEPFAEEYP